VTATLRGLLAAWAIAALLVIAAVASSLGGEGAADRALVPGFRSEDVTALAWEGSEGGGQLRIARDPASRTGWAWEAPRGAADPRAIDEVLSALRGGRWHRRAAEDAAGRTSVALIVTRGAASFMVQVCAELEGTDQRWLVMDHRAYLVDGWVARALAPGSLALRIRRPLAAIAGAQAIALTPGGGGGLVTVTGAPRRLVSPAPLLLDPLVVSALEQALSELEVIELPRAPVGPATPDGASIIADRVSVLDAGACPGAPGRHAIDGTAGPGCVEDAAWEKVRRAIAAFAQPPAQLVERRPAPLEPAAIVLADGAHLDLTGRPRVGDRDADYAAVAELLAALSSPAEPAALPASTAGGTAPKPAASLTVTDRGGTSLTLDLYPPSLVARRGEPIALRLGEGAFRLLARSSAELRDPTPWREEPTTISALELDGTTYTRGAVIGEWTRTGPGRDDPATVEKLAAALAAPVARPQPSAAPLRHTITLHIRPIGGAPAKHVLQLGDAIAPAATAATICPALVDNARVALAAEICAIVRTLSP
jgi:hypothetical protein